MRKALLCLTGVLCMLVGPGFGQDFDQYGGWTGLQGTNTSGFFRAEKINGRYWLVTPDNNVFWSVGHCVTQYYDTWGGLAPALGYCSNPLGNKAKYDGSVAAWVDAVKARNAAWGFNTSAAWGRQDITGYPECVRVINVTDRASALGCRMVDSRFADVFDPKFAQACDDRAKTLASNANNPWTIGSFPDNELHWSNPSGYQTLPDAFIAFPLEAYGKQYWVDILLKGKYTTIGDLNAAYGTSFADWDAVLACTSVPDDPAYPARYNDKLDFQEAIADKYYSLASSKMRQYAPNHIVFTTRWAMWSQGYATEYHRPFNERIWKKAGEYCDVFANNGYADFGYAETQFQHSTRVFENAKRPFMVTEHSYLANDSYFREGSWWLPTQMDRAVSHQNHLKTLFDLGVSSDPNDGQPAKTCMGLHWFQYYDEPSLGRPDGEAGQFGILNAKDEAFLPLVDVMSTVHSQTYEYLALGQPIVVPSAPTAVRPLGASLQVAEKASSFSRVYYPNDSVVLHSGGSLVDDLDAVKGKAWKATTAVTVGSFIQYGPYATGKNFWPSAACTVRFRLKTASNTTSGVVATIDAASGSGSTVYASRDVRGTDFAAANAYQEFNVTFSMPGSPLPDNWEFRVRYGGAADVWIDTTTISLSIPTAYVPGPISDSSASTVWWSAGRTTPDAAEWVVIDLLNSTSVQNLFITPGSADASGMPVDFRLQYSPDAVSWMTIPGEEYQGYINDGSIQVFSFAPVNARYFRLYATRLGADGTGLYRLKTAGFDVREVTKTGTPTFEWTAVPNAAGYTVLLSQEQGFPEEQTIRVSGISGTTYTPTIPMSPGTWHWAVKAVDSHGRGGHYLKTVRFYVGNIPDSQVDPALNMRGEQVTAWGVTDNDVTGGDGTVWVFRDTDRKVEGESSIRGVFTVNSLNKTTNAKNTGTADIPLKWVGPKMDYSGVSTFSFKLYPQRFADTAANIISPSKYLYFRMVDENAGTVVDIPVDPTGALPRDAWSTVGIPLGTAARTHVTQIEFYIKCGDAGLTWDERMIFNIDDMTQGIMRDRTPPNMPIVIDAGDYTASPDALTASWNADDPESAVSEYRYAIGTAPTYTDVAPWTSAGSSDSVTAMGLSLANGNTYFFSVEAANGEGLWSDIGRSDGILKVESLDLGDVHNNPDNANVSISSAIVTAGADQFASTIYVEAVDRSSGIRVYAPGLTARVGDIVSVSGQIKTLYGERVITYPSVTILMSGRPTLEPLALTGREVGGEAPNQYTPGVHEGIGLFNVGLLATVAGRVTFSDSTARYFYIDDGSRREDGSGQVGVKVTCSGLASGNVIPVPAQGSYAVLTGVVAAQSSGGRIIPVLRPRTAADIVTVL